MAGFITLRSPVVYPNGQAVPLYVGTGNRANVNSTAVASAATALPTGATLVVVRTTTSVWFAFGDNSVSAAADETSTLVLAGELVLPVPDDATHFSVLEVSADGVVQVEQLV